LRVAKVNPEVLSETVKPEKRIAQSKIESNFDDAPDVVLNGFNRHMAESEKKTKRRKRL